MKVYISQDLPVSYNQLPTKHKNLVKINYVLITLLKDLDNFIIRALIVMIIMQCSYSDVSKYYYVDKVVAWFLKQPITKTTLI
ncbi:hypothetical protein V6M85_08125 [Sulfolobus tengchongensis]|uniref:Uncharacterized protein n=1 Tax=Sulfolobus tengchongensis TaxID=207809 RepID=A0AAX4KZ07_9CREN